MGKTLSLNEHERSRQPNIGIDLFNGDLVDKFWPQIEAQLKLIPNHWNELWTLDGLRHEALTGGIQVWGVGPRLTPEHIRYEVVLFTQIASFYARNVIRVVLIFGDGLTDDHLDVIEASLENFARQQGCTMIDGILRPGWERVLRKRGVKPRGIYMSRVVSPETIQ